MDTIEELLAKIENAGQAMSETHDSWEHRCHAIMAALGLDFGGVTPDIPEQNSWYALNMKRMEDKLFDSDMENRQLRMALKPFAFYNFEDDADTQKVWETIYTDSVHEWFDYEDILNARQLLGLKA